MVAKKNPAFKSATILKCASKGMKTPSGKSFKWAQFGLKPAGGGTLAKVSRLILRMADVTRDSIRHGGVEFLDDQGDVTMARNFTVDDANNCVVAMHFGADGTPAKSVKLHAWQMRDHPLNT